MVPDVDEALCALLEAAVTGRGSISLDAPPSEPPSKPRVHAHLVAVREEYAGLHSDWDEIRDATNTVIGRRPPIRRFDLHYVVTAHAKEAAAEHALLDSVLRAVVEDRRVAAEHLPKGLAELNQPVLIRLDEPADDPHNRPDSRLRLGVVVNAAVVPPVQYVSSAPDRFHLDAVAGEREAPAPRPEPKQMRERKVGERRAGEEAEPAAATAKNGG